MANIPNKLRSIESVPDDPGPVTASSRSILLSTVQQSLQAKALDMTRHSIFRKFVLSRIFPMFAVVCLIGCQSAQEQAGASNTNTAATPKSDTANVTAPATTTTFAAEPTAKTVAPATEKPKTTSAIVPSTAAEPAAKPGVPAQIVSEGVVAAAKAAFETNKCGTCHFVGVFPVTRPSTAKNDLGSVGITRSSAWISGFLQKKEKLDGKLHMKTFGGTNAEIEALSQWLASQKAEPLPASGSN